MPVGVGVGIRSDKLRRGVLLNQPEYGTAGGIVY